jgi:tRNA/tmRNA/rRNA uracil-C5-methylase (TrmA/RlmC/RlmD family)
VYVACDPVALARDVGALTGGGYELESLEGFDLFPHTSHVEAVARLVRHDDRPAETGR